MEITVFTPVYNRRELISNLYLSLCNQTNKDFIWLIVDDGSTDGSGEVIKSFISEKKLNIRYCFQENQGKPAAHNRGVELCDTALFVCVDSDDILEPNAIEMILDTHSKNLDMQLLGYYFRKIDTRGILSGGDFAYSKKTIGLMELYDKYGFTGEMTIVLRTVLIKPYKFPYFKGEKFINEGALYCRIDKIAPMLWDNRAPYIFEYQSDGYSNNSLKLIAKNPYGAGYGYLTMSSMNNNIFQAAKLYAEFRGISLAFQLDSKQFNENVSIIKKLLAQFMIPHYIKLFSNIRKEFRDDNR